jgi:hypothetical protein
MKGNLAILTDIPQLRKDLRELFILLKKEIDYSNFDKSDDDSIPGLDVTIGCTFDFDDASISWNYQTGDNSYTGGAYGHPEWFTCFVTKRTNCKELADDIINEIHDRIQEIASWQKQQAAEVVA